MNIARKVMLIFTIMSRNKFLGASIKEYKYQKIFL